MLSLFTTCQGTFKLPWRTCIKMMVPYLYAYQEQPHWIPFYFLWFLLAKVNLLLLKILMSWFYVPLKVTHLRRPIWTKVASERLLSGVSPLVSLKINTSIKVLRAKWAQVIANHSGHLWETGGGGDLLLVREWPSRGRGRQKGLQGWTPHLLEKEQVTDWLTVEY